MCNLLLFLDHVNSATSGGTTFTEQIKDALSSIGVWIVQGLFNLLSPFVIWGCKIIILWCIITMFCTKDTTVLKSGFKAFLIFLVFLMIRSAVL